MSDAVKVAPKVFISYSWSGVEHEEFVVHLATTLRGHGVDVILDKWRLTAGQDKHVFMESMVTDPTVSKVLMICDRIYKEKADKRTGGVGTESQIISSELYAKVGQTKFIPVLSERGDDGKEFLPVFMSGRMYVDMSGDKWGTGLDELLRLIYDQPLNPEPSLGEPPEFLRKESSGLPMAKELRSTLMSIREGKANREGIENLFVKSVISEIERQYVEPNGDDYDEGVYQAILKTKGLRDQVSDYIEAVAAFSGDDPAALKHCFYLMEQLGQRFGHRVESGSYREEWADLYRFLALECALIVTAALLRHERWKMLRTWLRRTYLIRTNYGGPCMEGITIFDGYIMSMDAHRNSRLKSNRASISADLLKERASVEHTSFAELVQADVFLSLFSVAQLAIDENGNFNYWGTRTTLYSAEARFLPIFQKAVDPDIKTGIFMALGVSDATDLANRVEQARSKLNGFKSLSNANNISYNFEKSVNLTELIRQQ